MENKYITVAYKLYTLTDGKKELLEEAPADHPFQIISGIGYTLDRFEKKIRWQEAGETGRWGSSCFSRIVHIMEGD